jgi:plastocyanin
MRRRALLKAGGLALAGLAVPRAPSAARLVEIAMRATARGEQVWFDPIGIWIAPGTTVRWTLHHDVHTTTAYHPANDGHSLRIPEAARPWNSGFLLEKGAHFDVTLTVEGVYDYFCLPHEQAGMVGRVIVGTPGGPGARAFDYFEGSAEASAWKPVPPEARRAFPSIAAIMTRKVVRRA